TNRGGQLVSLVDKSKLDEAGAPLEMVQRRSTPPWPFALVDGAGAGLALNEALFVAEQSTSADGEVLVLQHRGPAGEATKRFVLHPDGRLDLEVAASVPGFGVLVGPGLRSRTGEELENRFLRRAAVWSVRGEAGVEPVEKIAETVALAGTGLDWVADGRIQPMLLDAGDEPDLFDARPLPPADQLAKADSKLPREAQLVLVADNGRITAASYWGSKQYDRLKALPWGLEQTVRW